MFTLLKTISHLPFFKSINYGYITNTPFLSYCHVKFEVINYEDILFSDFGIPFDPKLDTALVCRRAEYLASRYAAKLLLEHSECFFNVKSSSTREPIWPKGWCGSISHTHNNAIVIVTSESNGILPGIDIELFDSSVMLETADFFTTERERELLLATSISYTLGLLIIFSAKESLFKSLYPKVRHIFYFDTAEILQIDIIEKKFTLVLVKNISEKIKTGTKFEGCYFFQDDKIITIIT
ncbi:4'-phosphopantetheinyl transferase superfamily protein [Marinomonas sp. TI.3.20]|uniref:4'-phosphopantetheinyl transferase family protein n=1 Tax=Marinomonas sp. TI.3.20 TaxID=3121296 RepID=UPI00311F9433